MTHQYTQLHQYLLSAIDDIRLRLGDANIGHFELTITASGRTLGSESPRIEYLRRHNIFFQFRKILHARSRH